MAKKIKLLMVDNYDSFTFNIVQYFGELGAEVEVFRNDEITLEGIAERRPDRLVRPERLHEAFQPLCGNRAGTLPDHDGG